MANEIEYRRVKPLGSKHEIVMSGSQYVGYSGTSTSYYIRVTDLFEGRVRDPEYAAEPMLSEAERLVFEMAGSRETAADLDELAALDAQMSAVRARIRERHGLE